MDKESERVLRESNKRLRRQVEREESRNADLRAQLENALHGKPAKWSPFERCNMAIGPDGRAIQLDTVAERSLLIREDNRGKT